MPNNPAICHAGGRAASTFVAAQMYNSASKGILRQAVTGAGTEFKRMADDFTAKSASHDGGVGHCLVGGFYFLAPWPLGDKQKALEHMEAAVAVRSKSRRNHYYVCLFKYKAGDASGALPSCEAAQRATCDGPTEPDYCPFITKELEKLTGLVRKALK